jgi:hypothetical protein
VAIGLLVTTVLDGRTAGMGIDVRVRELTARGAVVGCGACL